VTIERDRSRVDWWNLRLLDVADQPLLDHEVVDWLRGDLPRGEIVHHVSDLCTASDPAALATRAAISALQHAERRHLAATVDAYREALERPEQPSTNLPRAFWDARPELSAIRQAAWARRTPADSVLGAVLARTAWLVDPAVTLPSIIGARGTLDLCVALIGRSGAGKSASLDVAADMLPHRARPGYVSRGLGSGEGLIDAYLGKVDIVDAEGKKRVERRQVNRHGLFTLDEGAAFRELGSRQGSTLWPTIRSAWSGSQLGQANANEDRNRHLDARSYRFAMVAGFQPEYAAAMLADLAGGTPQRFLWLSALDPDLPDDPPDWPELGEPEFAIQNMTVDRQIEAEVAARHLARSRGYSTEAPIDSHRDLLRLKVAGLLTLIDGRVDVGGEDWHLAGIILNVSDAVRGTVYAAAAAGRAAQTAEDAERAAQRAVAARGAVEGDSEARALEGAARAIARHVHRQACEGGCRKRCVSRAPSSAHLRYVSAEDAISYATLMEWITEDFRPGRIEP
jgi:hypothetical protein